MKQKNNIKKENNKDNSIRLTSIGKVDSPIEVIYWSLIKGSNNYFILIPPIKEIDKIVEKKNPKLFGYYYYKDKLKYIQYKVEDGIEDILKKIKELKKKHNKTIKIKRG